jgi:glutathione synthase/RimK-type ligase-like ATP-grasp enzyme
MKKVLILSSFPDKPHHHRLSSGHTLRSYNDISIELEPKSSTFEIVEKNHSITDYSFVYFRTADDKEKMAIPLALCLNKLDIPFIDSALLAKQISSKSYQYAIFLFNGLPFPHSIIAFADKMKKMLPIFEKKLGYPFIIKAVGGRKGEDNFCVKNKEEFVHVMANYGEDMLFVAQEFIPNDFDYRILTVGYKTAIVYKRIRGKNTDTHLNNVSKGGSRELVDHAKIRKLCKLAEKASKLLKREVCGVDIVVDKETGKPYIFEANAAPQLNYAPALKAVREYLEERS